MKGRPILLVLGLAFLSGCGSTARIGPLLTEFDAYEREARALSPAPPAADFLAAAQSKRAQAEPFVKQGKNADAFPILEKAVADARLALATAEADAAQVRAAACQTELARTRQTYQEAVLVLRETEKVAKTAPHDLPPEPLGMDRGPYEGLPTTLLAGQEPPLIAAADLPSIWKGLSDAAIAGGVSLAGPSARFAEHLDRANDSKTKENERAGNLYVATRAVQEAEATLRARSADVSCQRAGEQIAALFDGHDLALRATIEMERDMKDALRVEARDRQTELYDALHQLEGKYAHIQKTARGTILSLADILFDFDKATLKRDVEFNLVKVATILNQFSEMVIAVEGHTDNVGTAEYNLSLSERRAQAVHDFLVSQDVSPDRMTVAGYGLTRPVADNSTEEGRQKNRRVDLVIQDRP